MDSLGKMTDAMCTGEYYDGVRRVKTVFSLGARISIIKDFLTNVGKFNPVHNPKCQMYTKAGLSATNIKELLKMIFEGENENATIEFTPCDDGCDDVIIVGGGRIFLHRECPDCSGELIRGDLANISLKAGIVYTCPTAPLTHYIFVNGKLKKIYRYRIVTESRWKSTAEEDSDNPSWSAQDTYEILATTEAEARQKTEKLLLAQYEKSESSRGGQKYSVTNVLVKIEYTSVLLI